MKVFPMLRMKLTRMARLRKTNRDIQRHRFAKTPRGPVEWRDKDQLCKEIFHQKKLAKLKQLQWSLSLQGRLFEVRMREAFDTANTHGLTCEQYRKRIEEIIGNLVFSPEPSVNITSSKDQLEGSETQGYSWKVDITVNY